jgi:hypothetical protein
MEGKVEVNVVWELDTHQQKTVYIFILYETHMG